MTNLEQRLQKTKSPIPNKDRNIALGISLFVCVSMMFGDYFLNQYLFEDPGNPHDSLTVWLALPVSYLTGGLYLYKKHRKMFDDE